MTAPALDRFADALTVARPATAFFAALDDADQRIAEREELQWQASMAPPVQSYASCLCGLVLEIRTETLKLTDAERIQVSAAIADLPRAAIVDGVVDALNEARAAADWQAMADWQDAHDYCEDYQ